MDLNVVVLEYEWNGAVGTLTCASQRGGEHAPLRAGRLLAEQGVPPEAVRRIYSEWEPCHPPLGTCMAYLSATFPRATIEYSFPQGDTPAERLAALRSFLVGVEEGDGELLEAVGLETAAGFCELI
ncbi:MAG: nucleic acid/nucleotide deaminase domain-containing protein, partial [Candidatus Eremiobacterota bacterium]